MAALRRILATVGVPAAAAPAVSRAASLATVLGAELRLFSGVYDPRLAEGQDTGAAGVDVSSATLIDERRQALDELVRPFAARGLSVSVAARWAYPAFEGVVAAAREFAADLLVTGSSRPARAGPAALTHSDWEVIRHSACPVLMIRGAGPDVYREIVVAVDPLHAHDRPAALDDALVALGTEIAGACGGRVRLLHCYLPTEYLPLRAPGAVSSAAYHRRAGSVEAHRTALAELGRRHGLAPEATLLELADPRDAIPEVTTRLGADLVIMGAVARSRLRRLLIGSTAEPVLDQLSCDVLVVKPAAPTS